MATQRTFQDGSLPREPECGDKPQTMASTAQDRKQQPLFSPAPHGDALEAHSPLIKTLHFLSEIRLDHEGTNLHQCIIPSHSTAALWNLVPRVPRLEGRI